MRIFLRSYGCSANLADSETLAGCLIAAGFKLTESEAHAQIVIYNTCAVKGPTENRIVQALKRLPANRKIIITGCLPLINYERLTREVHFDAIVGPAAGNKIVDIVNRVAKGEHVEQLENASVAKPSLALPRVRLNPIVSMIPVNYGCLGSCAYCCVVYARGHLRSYAIEEIMSRVKQDLTAGVREFWITSQDTASYGRDINTNLAELLIAVCAMPGDFRVRVGMMTPNIAAPILDELIDALGDEKVFKFLHLPVQSGDNEVLKHMRRFYTSETFREMVAAFRSAFPRVTVSTDVICGFPGETVEAHENTLQLLSSVKPDVVNVSKFFARPRTSAAQMKTEFVDPAEIKRRRTEAAKLVKRIAFEQNQQWIGWKGEILVDEKGKVENTWIGRNFAYKPITVRSNENLLGKTMQIRITHAFTTHLMAISE
jgi:threonylcarbamoyladenosine tRNA methylthiotransferase CDKAL1